LTAVACTGPNSTAQDPVQIMIIGNPANAGGNSAPQTVNIEVGLIGGTAKPGRIKIAIEGNGAAITVAAFPNNTSNATVQGHPGAAGAAAVGAAFFFETPACGTTPAQLETFSSAGGAPILFDASGTRLATPEVRQKPDFVGPDGGNDTFLGYTLASEGVTGGKLNTTIAACQKQSQLSEFLGYVGRGAACGRHRGTDAAGQCGSHTYGNLSSVAHQRIADGIDVAEFRLRLRIRAGGRRIGAHAASSAHGTHPDIGSHVRRGR